MITAGSLLSNGQQVAFVSSSLGAVINAVTASGTILVAGRTGPPLIASTHPADLLELFTPFPRSAAALFTFLFPVQAQQFYDSAIEPLQAQAD